jgi:hypothetical protein
MKPRTLTTSETAEKVSVMSAVPIISPRVHASWMTLTRATLANSHHLTAKTSPRQQALMLIKSKKKTKMTRTRRNMRKMKMMMQ